MGQILGGKAAERSRIAAVAQPVAEMLDAEPAPLQILSLAFVDAFGGAGRRDGKEWR
jgi:hypothetical protein